MYRVVNDKDLRGESVCVYQTEKTKNNSFRLSISNAKGWRPKTALYISNPVCFEGLNVGSRWKIIFYSTRGRSINCFRLEDCKEELFRTFLIILLGSVFFFHLFKEQSRMHINPVTLVKFCVWKNTGMINMRF